MCIGFEATRFHECSPRSANLMPLPFYGDGGFPSLDAIARHPDASIVSIATQWYTSLSYGKWPTYVLIDQLL
jgi:hypothetical protein